VQIAEQRRDGRVARDLVERERRRPPKECQDERGVTLNGDEERMREIAVAVRELPAHVEHDRIGAARDTLHHAGAERFGPVAW
jgi:hypothetical protein